MTQAEKPQTSDHEDSDHARAEYERKKNEKERALAHTGIWQGGGEGNIEVAADPASVATRVGCVVAAVEDKVEVAHLVVVGGAHL